MPEHIGSLALRKGGGAVVALGDGFYTLNFDTGTSTKLVDPDPGNDGKVDRQGRFVAGYMDYEEREPLCSVFRLDINHTVTPLDRGTVCPNGPCRSPDGRTFYFADTYCREIWAYDYDTATATSLTAASLPLTPLPISVDCRMADRRCRGLRVEYVRLRRQARALRPGWDVGPHGGERDERHIRRPHPTSPTSPRWHSVVKGVRQREPESGGLFAVYGLGVRGIPEPRFRG